MNNSRQHRAGFSLIELMISLAIVAIVTSQLLLSFSEQHRSYVEQDDLNYTQQDVRVLTDAILADLRMAGFMVPREYGVGSIDGSTTGPDVLCTSDPSVFVAAEYEAANDRFSATSVTSSLGGDDSTLTLQVGEMDLDDDGNDDFAVGAGILVSDGNTTHCARITALSTGSVTFIPNTPVSATFSVLSTRAVPATIYQVTGALLTRNGIPLSSQIEDLQVEFGIDADANGKIEGAEFPVNDLTGVDRNRLRLARVSVTSRTARADVDFTGTRAAAANRTAGGADNFKRRRAVADAVLRNMR